MGKKRKPLPPRVKRMRRPARLASAGKWLSEFTGKNVLKGYCNHFAVDWQCASVELKMLGVKLDPLYLEQRRLTSESQVRSKLAKKLEQQARQSEHWHPYTDEFSAYMAGDFEALHDLQMQANGNSEDY